MPVLGSLPWLTLVIVIVGVFVCLGLAVLKGPEEGGNAFGAGGRPAPFLYWKRSRLYAFLSVFSSETGLRLGLVLA